MHYVDYLVGRNTRCFEGKKAAAHDRRLQSFFFWCKDKEMEDLNQLFDILDSMNLM